MSAKRYPAWLPDSRAQPGVTLEILAFMSTLDTCEIPGHLAGFGYRDFTLAAMRAERGAVLGG
jgi:hypothetical protein